MSGADMFPGEAPKLHYPEGPKVSEHENISFGDPFIHSSLGSLLCGEWTGDGGEEGRKLSAFVIQVNKCTCQSLE